MTKRQRQALIAVTLSSSVVFLDGSVVNLALPRLASELHANFAGLQWIVEGYLLSLSALILLGGTLGDIYGRKRLYLSGLAGFGVASLFCALAPSTGVLIAMRLLQGVFGALLIPGALAIIDTNFRPAERGAAFGHWTAWSSAAVAVGPPLGGYLIDAASWRWIFIINLPLLAASAWLAIPGIRESQSERSRRVDGWGALLAALALAGIVYGLIEGPVQQWAVGPVVSLVLGLVLAAVFIGFERRQRDPMLDLDLFRSRNFNGANLATFALYGALAGFFFVLVIHLQTAVGFSSLMAGVSTLPVTLLLLALSSRFGRLSTRYGPRRFMTAGPLLVGLGMLMLWPLHHGSAYWSDIFPGIMIFGLGMAMTVTPLTTTVMAAVDAPHAGIASAINNAVSRVAGLVIIALLGLVGVSQVYGFTLLLCASLAVGAGVMSFMMIRTSRL